MKKTDSTKPALKLFFHISTVVGIYLAISSPLAYAQVSHNPITMKLIEMSLSKLVYIFSEHAELNIINTEIIPDSVTAVVELNNVPADEVFANILRCGGLGYVQSGNDIELFQKKEFDQPMRCTLNGDGKVEDGKLVYRN